MLGDGEDIRTLLAKAAHARKHAKWITDDRAANALCEYAAELEAKVEALRKERAAPVPVLPKQAADAPTGEPEFGPALVAALKPTEPPPDSESN